MADKENYVRLTRAAAKRSASSADSVKPHLSLAHEQPPTKRKRVALKELPNLSNTAAPRPSIDLNRPPPSNPIPTAKNKGHDGDRMLPPVAPTAAPDTDLAADDPQLCSQDASDIDEYLRSMEVEPKRRPRPNFLEVVQTNVTANMRAILVDWLVEVAEEYKLIADTLFLTVSYIDRFLSFNALSRQKLQLLGVSAMLIASKYEEISPPHVEDFCYITDNTYTKQEVVKMESDILKWLNFEMGNPTIKTFLRRFTRVAQEDVKHPNLRLEFLGSYLAELGLLDYGCAQFLPSVVAGSAVFVARLTIHPEAQPWNKMLEDCTGYRPSELKDCIYAIHDLQLSRKGSSLVAVREKYKQHRFKCVSTMLPPLEIPVSYFEDLKG